MPELPEVETTARNVAAALRGARVIALTAHRPDYLLSDAASAARRLVGKRLSGCERHGKRLTLVFGSVERLHVSLGMSGNLLIVRGREPLDPHDHVALRFARPARELRFRDPRRFGACWLAGRKSDALRCGRFSGALGPDALSVSWPEFRRMLQRDRQIKALLLDQGAIAGLGNIYTDEALFRGRIHPLQPARSVDDRRARGLYRAMRRVLAEAIDAGGSSIRDYTDPAGSSGWFQVRHRVYGREGKPCPRCRAVIRRIRAAGRSTHLCPACQVMTPRR